MEANEPDLARIVWSEQGLMELLGCKKNQIRRMRTEYGLPFVRLQKGLYAYMAGDVLAWLGKMREASASTSPQCDEEVGVHGA